MNPEELAFRQHSPREPSRRMGRRPRNAHDLLTLSRVVNPYLCVTVTAHRMVT